MSDRLGRRTTPLRSSPDHEITVLHRLRLRPSLPRRRKAFLHCQDCLGENNSLAYHLSSCRVSRHSRLRNEPLLTSSIPVPVQEKPHSVKPSRNIRSSSGLSATSIGIGSVPSASGSRTSLTRASMGAAEEKHHAYGGRMLGRLTGKASKGRPSTAPDIRDFAHQAPTPPAPPSPPPPTSRPPDNVQLPRSPEVVGKRFELDTDLNDMEGIVDLSQFQAVAGPYSPGGSHAAVSAGRGSGRPRTPSAQTSSSAGCSSHAGRPSNATSTASEGSSRVLISPAEEPDNLFQGQSNPFFASTDFANGSTQLHSLPPSPQTTLPNQPTISNITHPRRPSALRQVESHVSDLTPGSTISPSTPGTSQAGLEGSFDSGKSTPETTQSTGRRRPNMRLDLQPNTFTMDAAGFKALSALTPDIMSPGTQMQAFRLTPMSEKGGNAGTQAAWQAPESWGVEGDEEPEDAPSSDEGDDLPDNSHDHSPEKISAPQPIDPKKPPPFGYNSGLKRKQRPNTGNPSIKSRPTTAGGKLSTTTRPTTSGSNHANVTVSVYLDGTPHLQLT